MIAGDYGDDGRFTDRPNTNLYGLAADEFEDVSRAAMRARRHGPVLCRRHAAQDHLAR